jgi:hypothetical protein
MMRDRSDDDALAITQSLLAEMLGVQRPTITQAVRELERAGANQHGRRKSQYVIGRVSWRNLANVISPGTAAVNPPLPTHSSR